MSTAHINLYDEDTETEVSVFIDYSTQPADEEVGITSAYGELQNVSTWIPAFGTIIFNLAPAFEAEVEQAMDDQVWEDEATGLKL